ncbi:DNA mismatch repair endonuclease MutL [Lacrimispora sp. 210928-DFI.3.58]|uniref:DNA mismatch repair endonuclease MutL n=1 Tax=Lacrimispora sp. 210928-DFI.3.58 TaxID=2883214 RepID=UPI001D071795|nr:DNA mismatch repair endonuclease MutL [Lacrimispora sp. 210928-DFI.3.58]MCB7319059.1 DNA mismatch repair endonuclease MutL [Lacrimispora sp. 210928-DFI.3.58]
MPTITVLDQNTINKIAAGEVIERPASVVKELLENAIDAQATAVTVEIKEGGCSLIRITDNGCGIPKDQIPLAFLRHATSKIQRAEDLMSISSLGFRGEALASIASVAQVELISKTGDSLTGTRYQIEGGREKSMEEVGAPEGTTIIARNLFFNTPARKKFLKTPMTEAAHVASLVEKIALSHPDISIRFIQNNQNKLYTSGNHNLKDLIYTVFGREIAANLLEVDGSADGIRATGYIGKPVIARSNRNYENYFINGRYIRSSIISKAIEEAYKPFMMQHKYPFTMLHLSIDPQTLDVNVHPTKMELRFSDGERVFRAVFQAVGQALAHKELIPQVELDEKKEEKRPGSPAFSVPEPFESRRKSSVAERPKEGAAEEKVRYSQAETPPKPSLVNEQKPKWLKEMTPPKPSEMNRAKVQPYRPSDLTAIQGKEPVPSDCPEPCVQPEQLDLFDGRLLDPKARKSHKLIGQLFDTYWLVEYNEQLFIIDQHAAHEKVLYEKTIATLKTRSYDTQMVEPPIILTLNMNEEVLLEKYMAYFTGIGFEIEPFGGREYAVRGVPSNLFSIAKKELLLEMIDGLSEDMAVRGADSIYEKVASMSCKAAVKGRHSMSAVEANELIDQLLTLDNPYACPHGRPTIISMTKYELEKKFKRIV